jgi:N-acetylmuramoyl-L-alanine amidase
MPAFLHAPRFVPRPTPLLAAAALLLALAARAASHDPIVLILDGQRREVVPVVRGTAELIALEQVTGAFGLQGRASSGAGTLTLSSKGHEVILYAKKSLASLDGDLKLLSAPVVWEDGRWLVPVDAIPRLIGPLLGLPAEYRAATRVLVVGPVSVPRVTVSTFVSGEMVRVVLEASEKVTFRAQQEAGRVSVAIPRELVDVAFQQERLTGGIVDLVQFTGGRENSVVITLGRRFQQLKAFEQERPTRLVLEFQAAPLPTRAPAATPAPASGRGGAVPPSAPPVLVLDPGHGGPDQGAKGPGGATEKDVTLAIARKLRTVAVNNLGYQVFLTRDRDQELSLDERAAIANNYKADLFVSIHTNASRAARANGSEVYFLSYQASDDASRQVAVAEGEAPVSQSAAGSDLQMILWDMAQAAHLEESSALASRIQEELAVVTASEGRGVKQAPFRVLVGAAMPAALVEVAFISNPEEEQQLVADAFQNKVAAALARGIARYAKERANR